jgi:crotonobetainyl-CoA:carnitine CoA-transferase CaiB-like acyl-CoA transferase
MNGLPLEGTRVVELTHIYAGPYASMQLADWGAELIRVETIQTLVLSTRGQYTWVPQEMLDQAKISGSAAGMAFPDWDPGPRPWNRSASMTSTGRNKLSMTADLLRPEGRDILGRLLQEADVFIENNVPDTMEKLNITYEWVRELNPNIIMIRMPAFGLTGPYTNFRCLGLHVDGVATHSHTKGYADTEPSRRGETVAPDAAAGAAGAFATLMALWHRKRTGKGQMVELTLAENFIPFMADSVLDFTMNGRVRGTIGNRDYRMAPHGVYPCAGDDHWMTLAVATDEEWQGLCEVMGDTELAVDPRFADAASRWNNQDELDDIVSEWTRQQDHREAFHRLQKHGVPAGPVLDELEALEDPHLVERGYYEPLDHPEMPTLRYHGPLWRMSKTPNKLRLPPPLLGEHNSYVYKDVMGFSENEYLHLEAEGHIGMDILQASP